MTEFNERKLRPKKDNKNYYTDYNYLYAKGWVDECTWYVVGRLLEIGVPRNELIKNLPQTNAENWYNDSKYPKQHTAAPGCIIVYSAGKVHHAADGMGHVAFVEHVYDDGRIRITESGKNMKFQSRIIKPPYKYYLNVKNKENYKLDGFVKVIDTTPAPIDDYWIVGKTYKMIKKKWKRYGAYVGNNKVPYPVLSATDKKKCDNVGGYARTKIGVEYTFYDFVKDEKGNTWACTTKPTSTQKKKHFVCVEDSTGKQAIKV